MTAMPVLIAILCVMAIAYRYYSAFLAARVAALDDARATPAVQLNDGQNYHPTNKWVLFGHHFAAISGAGAVDWAGAAAQFGYLPGLLWIGDWGLPGGGGAGFFWCWRRVWRRGGGAWRRLRSATLAGVAGTAAMVAILFIIVIALAGLGKGGCQCAWRGRRAVSGGEPICDCAGAGRRRIWNWRRRSGRGARGGRRSLSTRFRRGWQA